MTASTVPHPRVVWRDYYAEVTVIAVTLLALLLGWALKSSVEARSRPFEAAGISAQVPADWYRTTATRGEVLRATNQASPGFGTTYVIETVPVGAGTPPAQVVSLLTLQRAQDLTAYRVLDQQQVTINGREAHMLTFVYVEANPDVMRSELPQVVRGVEFVFLNGERAVVVAYHAGVDVYEAEYGRFRQFLNSVTF
jgi:hypothetical protein